jgi:flagellar hook-length control protein FliK
MGDPALQAAVAQLTEEIGQTPPGTIRDIELRLNSEGLGRVRVRLKLLDTGAVRIEFTTPTERAAQVLRGDLPQLVAALEGRGTVLDGSRVLVAPVGAFAGNGSSDQSRQGSRWFERPHRRNAGTAGGPEGFVAAAAYGRRQLVDVLA